MLRATPDGVTLAVRVQPGAKKTAIIGIYGEGATAQLKNRRPRSAHRRPRQPSPHRIPRRKIPAAQVRHHLDLRRTLPQQNLPSVRSDSRAGTGSISKIGEIVVWNYRAQAPKAAASASSGSGRTRKSACASAKTTSPAGLITYVAGSGSRQLDSPFTNGMFTRIER